jgi:hypothetical protein
MLKEVFMKKWYFPLVVLGAGGMGALLVSDAGRKLLDRVAKVFEDDAEQLNQLNDAAARELENIQKAIDNVAETLGVRGVTAR